MRCDPDAASASSFDTTSASRGVPADRLELTAPRAPVRLSGWINRSG
jgi:hypothetical protein